MESLVFVVEGRLALLTLEEGLTAVITGPQGAHRISVLMSETPMDKPNTATGTVRAGLLITASAWLLALGRKLSMTWKPAMRRTSGNAKS